MAYDKSKLVKLGALEALAQRVKDDYATKASVTALENRVDALVTAGGEPNVITSVKVNGSAQTITDKSVNITVPTKVSQITNDSGFQTSAQVTAAIGGLRTELMGEGVPEAYDTFKELADYIETHQTAADALNAAVGNKVDKVTGKGLSTNDYTDADKAKLDGMTIATDAEVTEMLNTVFGAA